MIVARPYAASDQQVWDAFVSQAKNGHFMFLRSYMEYHRHRFQDCSLMLHRGSRLVAVLPAHVRDGVLCSHEGLPFAGVLSGRRMRLDTMHEVFDALGTFMHERCLRELRYQAIPSPYHRQPAEEDLWALEQHGAAPIDSKVGCFLRLGDGSAPSRSRLRSMERARRLGVVTGPSSQLGPFMDLCAEFLGWRHGATPVHSREEMELLHRRFPGRIRLYVASRNGARIGGLIVYKNEPCSRLQYVAVTPEGRDCAALDAIYHRLLHDESDLGEWLDLGTSMDPATGAVDEGLVAYKESLGGRVVLRRSYAWRPGGRA